MRGLLANRELCQQLGDHIIGQRVAGVFRDVDNAAHAVDRANLHTQPSAARRVVGRIYQRTGTGFLNHGGVTQRDFAIAIDNAHEVARADANRPHARRGVGSRAGRVIAHGVGLGVHGRGLNHARETGRITLRSRAVKHLLFESHQGGLDVPHTFASDKGLRATLSPDVRNRLIDIP